MKSSKLITFLVLVHAFASGESGLDKITNHNYLKSSDTGVKHCLIPMHTNDFEGLAGKIKPSPFRLHVWMKLLSQQGSQQGSQGRQYLKSASSEMRIALMVEPMPDSRKLEYNGGGKVKERLLTVNLPLVLDISNKEEGHFGKHLLQWNATIKFHLSYWGKNVLPFVTHSRKNLTVRAYEIKLWAFDNDKELCMYRPSNQPVNWILEPSSNSGLGKIQKAYGPNILRKDGGRAQEPRAADTAMEQINEAVLVSKPIWPMNEASLALLGRHLEHHNALGFTG